MEHVTGYVLHIVSLIVQVTKQYNPEMETLLSTMTLVQSVYDDYSRLIGPSTR